VVYEALVDVESLNVGGLKMFLVFPRPVDSDTIHSTDTARTNDGNTSVAWLNSLFNPPAGARI
jgi:hypothetical protein